MLRGSTRITPASRCRSRSAPITAGQPGHVTGGKALAHPFSGGIQRGAGPVLQPGDQLSNLLGSVYSARSAYWSRGYSLVKARVSGERTRRLVPANRRCPALVAISLAKGERIAETMLGDWRISLILHSARTEALARPKSAPGSSVQGTRSRGCHGLQLFLIQMPWKPTYQYLASQVAFPLALHAATFNCFRYMERRPRPFGKELSTILPARIFRRLL